MVISKETEKVQKISSEEIKRILDTIKWGMIKYELCILYQLKKFYRGTFWKLNELILILDEF